MSLIKVMGAFCNVATAKLRGVMRYYLTQNDAVKRSVSLRSFGFGSKIAGRRFYKLGEIFASCSNIIE